jgi:acetylornithine/succinyldiaminopimelate/putrescine aminotransferase
MDLSRQLMTPETHKSTFIGSNAVCLAPLKMVEIDNYDHLLKIRLEGSLR